MSKKIFVIVCCVSAALLAACSGTMTAPREEAPFPAEAGIPDEPGVSGGDGVGGEARSAWQTRLARQAGLARLAEKERGGAYVGGMGLAESALREEAGDHAGAVFAAFKELLWLYGQGSVDRNIVAQSLRETLEGLRGGDGGAQAAARGALAFFEGRWEDALAFFGEAETDDEEPDSFFNWMKAAARLASGRGNLASYGAIRARYSRFPAYWHFGAAAYRERQDDDIAFVYAENCVNASPKGPYAAECRAIIAGGVGLDTDSAAPAILSLAEIDSILRWSVKEGEPELLRPLFPLIALPDNSYTHYALGAMRSLAEIPAFKSFYKTESDKSRGRLRERLHFVSQG